MSSPILSPDGKFVWNGTTWIPVLESPDGNFVWDGTEWRPRLSMQNSSLTEHSEQAVGGNNIAYNTQLSVVPFWKQFSFIFILLPILISILLIAIVGENDSWPIIIFTVIYFLIVFSWYMIFKVDPIFKNRIVKMEDNRTEKRMSVYRENRLTDEQIKVEEEKEKIKETRILMFTVAVRLIGAIAIISIAFNRISQF